MIHRKKSKDYCFKLKKVIASILALTIFGFQSNLIVFATNITGVSSSNNVYNIKPTHWNNAQTGFRQYSNFDLSRGDSANLIFKYGNNDISRFVNLVGNKVNINGVLNSVNGNGQFTAGNVVFISPNGMAVGSSGVVNVGALSVYTPSKLPELNQMLNLSETGLNNAFDSYKNSSNGLITINGQIFTQRGMELYGRGIEGSGKTVSGFKNVDNSVAYSQAGIAGAVDYNTAKANANALFSKLVNTGNTMANSSEFDFSGNDGKVVLASKAGINLDSGTNIVNGDLTIENKNYGHLNINNDMTANGNVYIYNGKITNSDLNMKGKLTNLSSSGKTTIINDEGYRSSMYLTGDIKVNGDIDIINKSYEPTASYDPSGQIVINNLINDGVNAKTNIINEKEDSYKITIKSIATKGDTYIENKGWSDLTVNNLSNSQKGAKTTILQSNVDLGPAIFLGSAYVNGDTKVSNTNGWIDIGTFVNSGDGAKTEISTLLPTGESKKFGGIVVRGHMVTNGDTIISNDMPGSDGSIYINYLRNDKAGAKTQIVNSSTKYGITVFKFPNGEFVRSEDVAEYLRNHPEYRDLVDMDFWGSPEVMAAIWIKNINVNGQLDVVNKSNTSILINNLVNNLDGAVTNITNKHSTNGSTIGGARSQGGLYLVNAKVNGDIKTFNEDYKGTYIGTLKNLKSGALTEIHNISLDDIAIDGITINDLSANGKVDILNNVYVSSSKTDNGINISKLVNTSSKDNTTIVNAKQEGSEAGKVSINLLDHIETNGDLLIQNLSEGDINLSKDAIIKNNAGKTHIVNAENVSGQMNLLGLIDVNNDLWINNKSNDDLVIGGSIINNSNDGLTLITNNGNWLNIKNDTLESQINSGKYNYDAEKVSDLNGGSIKITGNIQTQGETVIANGGNGNIEIGGSVINGIKNDVVLNSNAKTTISNTKNGQDIIISNTGNVVSASDLLIENAGTGSIDIKGNVESKLSNVDINNSMYEIDLVRTEDNTSSHPFLSSGKLEKVNIVRSPKAPTANGKGIKISGTVKANNNLSILNGGTSGITEESTGSIENNNGTTLVRNYEKANEGILIAGAMNLNGNTWIDNKGAKDLTISGNITNGRGTTIISNDARWVNDLDSLNTVQDYLGENINISGNVTTNGYTWVANAGKGNINISGNMTNNKANTEISNTTDSQGINISGTVKSKYDVLVENAGSGDLVVSNLESTQGNVKVNNNIYTIDIVRTINNGDESLHKIVSSKKPNNVDSKLNVTGTIRANHFVDIFNGGNNGIVTDNGSSIISDFGRIWIDNIGGGDIDLSGNIVNNFIGGSTIISNAVNIVDNLTDLNKKTDYAGSNIKINDTALISTKGKTEIANASNGSIIVDGTVETSNDGKTNISNTNKGDSITVKGTVNSDGSLLIENTGSGSINIAGNVSSNKDLSIQNQTYSLDIVKTIENFNEVINYIRLDQDSPNLAGGVNITGNVTSNGDTFIQNAGNKGINISKTSNVIVSNGDLNITNAKEGSINANGKINNKTGNVTITNADLGNSINIQGDVVSNGDMLIENSGSGNIILSGNLDSTLGNISIQNQTYSIDTTRNFDSNNEVTLIPVRTYYDIDPSTGGGITISGDINSGNDLSIANGGKDGITITSSSDIITNGDTWIDNKGGSDLVINGDLTNNSNKSTIISNSADRVNNLNDMNKETNYPGENIIIGGNIVTNGDTWIANDGSGNTNISGSIINNSDKDLTITNSDKANDINISGSIIGGGTVLIETGKGGNINGSNLVSGSNVIINEDKYDISIVRTRDNWIETLHKIVINRPEPIVPIVPTTNIVEIDDNDPTRLINDRLKKDKFLQLKRESIRYGINGDSLALSQASDHIEEIIDISKTGLAVKTDGGLKLSEDVKVSFEYKGIDITATAKVMRINDHNKTAGLKFTDVDALTANKILYVSMLRQADIQAAAGKLNPTEVSLTSKLLTQN